MPTLWANVLQLSVVHLSVNYTECDFPEVVSAFAVMHDKTYDPSLPADMVAKQSDPSI